jgi:hypothetical protein
MVSPASSTLDQRDNATPGLGGQGAGQLSDLGDLDGCEADRSAGPTAVGESADPMLAEPATPLADGVDMQPGLGRDRGVGSPSALSPPARSTVTELVYRHQLLPVMQTGATAMDALFGASDLSVPPAGNGVVVLLNLSRAARSIGSSWWIT